METRAEPSYGIYWRAWLALLGITILMLVWTYTPVLIAGMCVKAGVITHPSFGTVTASAMVGSDSRIVSGSYYQVSSSFPPIR